MYEIYNENDDVYVTNITSKECMLIKAYFLKVLKIHLIRAGN